MLKLRFENQNCQTIQKTKHNRIRYYSREFTNLKLHTTLAKHHHPQGKSIQCHKRNQRRQHHSNCCRRRTNHPRTPSKHSRNQRHYKQSKLISGVTPATKAKAIASGTRAKATVIPAKISARKNFLLF